MNVILHNDQINAFFNEAGNGETAQDITLIQPTDITSEDNGGNIPLGDIGNDISAAMETAHLGLASSKLIGSVLAKRATGMTEDAVNPFYGNIAKALSTKMVMNTLSENRSLTTGAKLAYSIGKTGSGSYEGTKIANGALGIKDLSIGEFRQMAHSLGTTGNDLGKELVILERAANLASKIGAAAGIGGTGLGLAMTGTTGKQSDKAQKAGGILSGAMSIAGLIAAPFTGGASLGLNIGAAAIGVGTGFA